MGSCCRTCCGLIAGILAACGLSVAGPAAGDDCRHKAPYEEIVEAAGAAGVTIDAAAGSLRVIGRDHLGEVRVRGMACASTEDLLEEVVLTVDRDGDRIHVVVEIPEQKWGRHSARLDLDIEVPSSLPLAIDDGSGDIELHGVGPTTLDDGSGEIRAREVHGDLRIDDGSGSIRVQDVSGEVWIDDGSGEIDVRGAGSVTIDDDGSGDIDVTDVDGDVTVRDDGSGSISVTRVGGDFTVRDDGSGRIRHREVGGQVSIPADD